MVTYEQAAVIIPNSDLQLFFNRYGLQLKATDSKQIGVHMYQLVQAKGKSALEDLQNLCRASLKKMASDAPGGCGCGGGCSGCSGGCSGCGDKKALNAGSETVSPATSSVVIIKEDGPAIKFLKKNQSTLVTLGIIVAAVWILKKL